MLNALPRPKQTNKKNLKHFNPPQIHPNIFRKSPVRREMALVFTSLVFLAITYTCQYGFANVSPVTKWHGSFPSF